MCQIELLQHMDLFIEGEKKAALLVFSNCLFESFRIQFQTSSFYKALIAAGWKYKNVWNFQKFWLIFECFKSKNY